MYNQFLIYHRHSFFKFWEEASVILTADEVPKHEADSQVQFALAMQERLINKMLCITFVYRVVDPITSLWQFFGR